MDVDMLFLTGRLKSRLSSRPFRVEKVSITHHLLVPIELGSEDLFVRDP